jgi:aspartate beta-hydroxylase
MRTPTRREARSFARDGAEALSRGDASTARELFTKAVAAGRGNVSVLLGLSRACRVLNDGSGSMSAVDRALAVEPHNVRALILKADLLADASDSKGASAFYAAALRSAPAPEQVPPEMAQELRRARAMSERYALEYQAHLRDNLATAGYDPATSSDRFTQSLDIIFGTRKIYVQEPRYYYFPGLPQIQFYPREDFPWLDEVEAATNDIRNELSAILADETAFEPYLQGDPKRPYKSQQGLLNNPDWGAFYLWKYGQLIEENAARCPKTMKALENVPLARFTDRSPSVLFSLLKPGARIPPHNGLANIRLICHLPLIIPEKCGFRVGNEQREWVEGRALVFDDTIEHEAWNGSDQTRVVLLFETWRPEISEAENKLISAMFEAIDAYSGTRPEWEI